MVKLGFIKNNLTVALTMAGVMALSLVAYDMGNAQESPDEGVKRELEEGQKPAPNSVLPKPKPSLDDLFADLRQETQSKKAKQIERAIWQRWGQSGSETIDLLMDWSNKAIKKGNWGTALDLVDQVVTLAPQYAEGWNRRATIYFFRAQFGHSMNDIEQVLRLESRHFGALAGLGSILQRLNNDREALVIWKNVLEIYPANKNAQKSVIDLEEKISGEEI